MQISAGIVIAINCVILCCHGNQTRQNLFHLGTSDFSKIVNTSTFVDKTLLIDVVFQENPKILITAPQHFGKSTNLNMLKTFLEIPVDPQGKPTQLNETKNYQLFMKNELKITKTPIMDDHFGTFPVIFVDIMCENVIRSYKDAVKFCRKVVRDSFTHHEYLIRSEKLTEQERSLVEQWCDEDSFNDFEEIDISVGLKVLSEMLCTHFDGKKTFALIDEYDSFIVNLNFTVENQKEREKISSFFFGLLGLLLTVNHHLGKAVITGTTYWAGNSVFLGGLNKFVKHFEFLEDHPFADYFGLTKAEVEGIFNKPEYKLRPNISDIVRGYRSKSGKYVYNFNSVFRTLDFEVNNIFT